MEKGVSSETYFNALLEAQKEFHAEREKRFTENIKWAKERTDIKVKHVSEIQGLQARLGAVAIDKAEASILERMETSNNKFALLKEQAMEFPTRKEVQAIGNKTDTLARLVYIGVGIVLVLQFILLYMK